MAHSAGIEKMTAKKTPTHLYYVRELDKSGKARALIMNGFGQARAYAYQLGMTQVKMRIIKGIRVTTYRGAHPVACVSVNKAKIFWR